jgi:hypothetical protein
MRGSGTIFATLFDVLLVAAMIMAVLGVLRFRFAVAFWRKMERVIWVWIVVMVGGALYRWFLA